MNFEDIRTQSLSTAASLGYELPRGLPLLDQLVRLRTVKEIEDRVLALSAVVAASYGLPRDRAISWLDREVLWPHVSPKEAGFLRGVNDLTEQFQPQVEGLCAFAWVLGCLPSLEFNKPAPAHLVAILPDLKAAEPAAKFREKARLRSLTEVVAACDLAYCLHWAIRQAALDQRAAPGNIPPHVVVERRRALEWTLSSDGWEDVTLDT